MPGRHGSSDQSTVENSLAQGYDMITGRITNRRYRKKVFSLYNEFEASRSSQSRVVSNGSGSSNATAIASSEDSSSGNEYAKHVSSFKTPTTANERYVHNKKGPKFSVPPPQVSEITILPGPHVANTIGLAAPWIELDSKDPQMAYLSYHVLAHELQYANFCGLKYVVLSGPKRRTHVAQYAQSVSQLLCLVPQIELVIHLPFTEEYAVDEQRNTVVPPSDLFSIWEVWNSIRTMCNYPKNLSLALQMPRYVPPEPVLSRWFSESVSMLVFTPRTFVPNAKGYPVLSKATQLILFLFFKKSPFLLVEEPSDTDSATNDTTAISMTGDATLALNEKLQNQPKFYGGQDSFLKYLRYLHQIAPPPSTMEEYAAGMVDVLQAPLQPLSDDLESAFYEVFERDSVKYYQYEKAIFYAIQDRPNQAELTIAIVGAGRGPLVDCCLRAAKAAGNRTVRVYAVEKNPSALVYLQARLTEDWTSGESKNSVELICEDMRSWQPPVSVRFDIIVSELLGSFGDNELSPECLDHVQKFLTLDGVMIPKSYRSFLTPVFCPKIYASAWDFVPKTKRSSESAFSGAPAVQAAPGFEDPLAHSGSPSSLQMPYIVYLQQADNLSRETKEAWSFDHPNDNHHYRKARLSFSVPHRSVLHGFAGYFEAELYNDIELSTKPDTMELKSKDMVSWFPIWFPITQPMPVIDSSEIVITMWRQSDEKRVWYEWAVETFFRKQRLASSIVHNSGGTCHSMYL